MAPLAALLKVHRKMPNFLPGWKKKNPKKEADAQLRDFHIETEMTEFALTF